MLPDAPPEPDAVIHAGDAYAMRRNGILHGLHRNGLPVRSLGAGIGPGAVSRLLTPLLLLELRDSDGDAGFWLLDQSLGYLGATLDAGPPGWQAGIADTIRPILDWLTPARLADDQPQPVAAFLSLQPGLRHVLAERAAGPPGLLPDPQALDVAPAAAPADHTIAVVPQEAGDDRPAGLAIGRTGLVLRDAAGPINLPAGWRAARICTLFFPTLLLELEHEDGVQAATWFLDQHGVLQGRRAQELPAAARSTLARALRPLFEGLWQAMLLGPEPALPPDAARFLRLPEATRLDLLALMLDGRAEAGLHTRTTMRTLAEALPPTLGHVVRTRVGQLALDPAHLRAACLQSLHESFAEQLRDGETGWPSPVDGARVRTVLQPLTLDNLCFAYRLHDPRHDLTVYVVGLEWHFRTFGLYFPAIDLMVCADAAATDRLRLYCLDFVELLQRHLVLYGDSIARGAARRAAAGPGPLLQVFRGEPSLHIGHYVWQDLSGLDWLTRHVPDTHLPYCMVFDTQLQAEMYGPIDQIHPALQGRVIRRQGGFEEAVRSVYESAARPMKFTSMHVRRNVGVTVMDAIDRDPAWQATRAAADAVPPGTPVVLIGLRVGNRAPVDQAGFVCRLVAELASIPGPAPVIVLDGHNQSAEGATYRSVGDDRPGAVPLVEAERAIAARVADTCAALGLVLIDTVGRPVAHSLIWCRRAQFFVAPWGAALAKYRWICNRPGLVMTGRWNLANRHDLDIYNAPRYLEAPNELHFLPAGHVEDIVLPNEPPDRANFRIDETAAFALVRQLARACPA